VCCASMPLPSERSGAERWARRVQPFREDERAAARIPRSPSRSPGAPLVASYLNDQSSQPWRPKSQLKASLSLPDLQEVDRHNIAYGVSWRSQIEEHKQAQEHSVKMAERYKHLAAVVEEGREQRDRPRMEAARRVLGTPLPANEIQFAALKPLQYEQIAADRREAMHHLHVDCLRREEVARRCHIASREATLAADRAETLSHLRVEAMFRVRANHAQLEEALQHKRTLEHQHGEVNRAAELAERRKLKSSLAKQRKQYATEAADAMANRRAEREAAEKQALLDAQREAKAKEQALKLKAERKAEKKLLAEREASNEYAQRLEKALKHAIGLAERAEEAFSTHVDKHGLHNHLLTRSARAARDEEALREQAAAEAEFAALENENSWNMNESSMTLGSDSSSASVFFESWAEAELSKLHARLELTRRRARVANLSYERARRDSLSPEELRAELEAQMT